MAEFSSIICDIHFKIERLFLILLYIFSSGSLREAFVLLEKWCHLHHQNGSSVEEAELGHLKKYLPVRL